MTPKYQAIADELRVHIQAGKYAAAQTLPTEFARNIRSAAKRCGRLCLSWPKKG